MAFAVGDYDSIHLECSECGHSFEAVPVELGSKYFTVPTCCPSCEEVFEMIPEDERGFQE